MVKRVLSFFLVLCLGFTLAVPAAADEYKNVSSPAIVELKNAFEYKAYLDNKLVSTVSVPDYWSAGGTTVEWRFTPSSSDYLNSIVVVIHMSSVNVPSSFQFYLYGNYHSMELLKKDGNLYYYRYTHNASFSTTNGIRLKATFEETYAASFNLISIYGIVENSKNVSDVYVSYDIYSWLISPREYGIVDSYSGNSSLPDFFNPTFDCTASHGQEDMVDQECGEYGLFKWKFQIADPYVSSVSFLMYAYEELYDAGIYIYDKVEGTVIAHVPVTVECCGSAMTPIFTDFSDFLYPLAYIVTADLTGFDLTDKDIYFTHKTSAYLNSYYSGRTDAVYVYMWAIEYIVQASETPFYVSIINWFKTQFNNVISTVSNGFSSVLGWITTIAQDLREGFDATITAIKEIYTALTGNQGAADDFNSELETQKGELEEITGALDSVTTPNVDDIELDFSGLKTGDNGEDFSLFFSIFFSNEIFLGMALIGVSLSLAAFALYGKR